MYGLNMIKKIVKLIYHTVANPLIVLPTAVVNFCYQLYYLDVNTYQQTYFKNTRTKYLTTKLVKNIHD